MDENIAIRITGLSKKYNISEKKTGLSLAGRLKEAFRFPNHKKVKKASDFYALKDINLEIKKGESVGIIGRNGAGKSTLLKILAEVVEPTEGAIEINGTIASVLEVGMGFHPELSGRENVYLSGAMLGMPKSTIARRFDEIVDFAGVGNFIDTPVKHYSSGMYLRLAFAVVVNVDADILLFDEVLSVGDSEFHMKVFQKINELKKQSKTILLVSHNIHDIGKFCDRTVFLRNGLVANSGATGSIITDYYNDIFDFLYNEGESRMAAKKKSSINPHPEPSLKGCDNEYIRISSPYIYAKGKSCDADILSSDEIIMEMDFENKNDNQSIDLAWSFSQYDNIFMIYTALNKRQIDLQKGRYKISGVFPAHILNDSHFKVDIRVVVSDAEDLSRILHYSNIQDAAAFRINGNFPEHEKRFFGPLFLRNNWVYQPINQYDSINPNEEEIHPGA